VNPVIEHGDESPDSSSSKAIGGESFSCKLLGVLSIEYHLTLLEGSNVLYYAASVFELNIKLDLIFIYIYIYIYVYNKVLYLNLKKNIVITLYHKKKKKKERIKF